MQRSGNMPRNDLPVAEAKKLSTILGPQPGDFQGGTSPAGQPTASKIH